MKNDIDFIWRGKKRTFFGLPWTFTTYYLTKTKFITRSGFIAVDEDEIDLYKITDKKSKVSFLAEIGWLRFYCYLQQRY